MFMSVILCSCRSFYIYVGHPMFMSVILFHVSHPMFILQFEQQVEGYFFCTAARHTWKIATNAFSIPVVQYYTETINILYCIVLYCIMRPYTDGPIGPLSYRHSSGVVRNPHSTLAE